MVGTEVDLSADASVRRRGGSGSIDGTAIDNARWRALQRSDEEVPTPCVVQTASDHLDTLI